MGKIILSFVLLILGLASCFAVPAVLAFKFYPSVILEVETGDESFGVENSSMHLLSVSRGSSVLSTNPAVTIKRSEIPDGEYGFIDRADDSRIELKRGARFEGNDMNSQFATVGGVELLPGSYGVYAPEMPAGMTLEVRKMDFSEGDEEGLAAMGIGALVGVGLGVLLFLAAVVFLILGIVEASRKKNPEA